MGLWSKLFGNVLPIGIDIIFLGQPRKVGLMTGIDTNDEGKTAIEVRFVGLEQNKVTGYYFDSWDFDPQLDQLNIKTYAGPIVCFKSIEGKDNFTPTLIKGKNEEIIKLHRMLDIYKKSNVDLLNIVESEKITGKRYEDTIEQAKRLKFLQDTLRQKDYAVVKKDAPSYSSMYSR